MPIADAQIKAIHSWVFLGGGLLLGGHEWGSASPNSGINWPGNRVTMSLGVVQTMDAWDVEAHGVSSACPSPLLLADQAAIQLRTNATVNATAADKSLALAKVSKAMQ
jgi:hypothetical protein